MADIPNRKLGKSAPLYDVRTLRLGAYLKPELPPPPPSVTNSQGLPDWGEMLNDNLSCCTIAAIGHAVQVWTLAKGAEVTVPDADVLAYYSKWDGYVPTDPTTDSGGIALDVLNKWRQEGFSGHELLGFTQANPRNALHVQQAIAIFGGLYVGLSLPVSAQEQDVWEVTTGANAMAGGWGGHAVWCPDYDADGVWAITWGIRKKMSWDFFGHYADECFGCISPDWPSGFNADAFTKDLAAITN